MRDAPQKRKMFALSDDDWRSKGNCRSMSVHAFYAAEPGQTVPDDINLIRAVCGGCEVQLDCLEYAIDNETHGVWGGSTPRERDRIRRRRLFLRSAS